MLSELVNPLHLCLALGPLSVYLLLLGMINLSSRPYVTTGARDAAALGIGIGGFVIIGPLYMLLPSETLFHWGGMVWLLLLAFYVLTLTLAVLLIRPRLIIYNMPADRVRPVLANLVTELDQESRWAGSCLVMPQLGVQLQVESQPGMRNVQLVAAGHAQSYEGWRRLEKGLVRSLRATKSARNPLGFSLLFAGLMVVAVVTFWMLQDPHSIAQSVQDMFRFPPDL